MSTLYLLATIKSICMKRFTTLFVIAIILIFQSCAPKKPLYSPTSTPVVHNEPPAAKDPFVPFTRELFDKLSANNIDVKLVQFYIDQQLVLTRFLSNDQVAVKNGVIKLNSGKYVNEIVFPQYTPVVCETIEGDGLRVNAETNPNTTLKFLNSKQYSPVNYIFNPDKWNKDGSTEVIYNGNKYSVQCPTCSTNSPNEAKLVVKQSALDNLDKQSTIIKGRTIGGNFINGSNNGNGY